MATRMRYQNYALDFKGIGDWNTWWSGFKAKHANINSNFTNFESFSNGMFDVGTFIDEAQKIQGNSHADQQRDAILAQAVVQVTKHAAPVKYGGWLVNRSYVETAIDWFQQNSQTTEVKLWDASYDRLKAQLPDLDQVKGYIKSAVRFRSETGLPGDIGFAVLQGATAAQWKVPMDYITEIQEMLTDMRNRQNLVFGSNRNKEQSRRNGEYMASLILGTESILGEVPWGSWNKRNKGDKKLLLSSTAIMNALQNNLITEDDIKRFEHDMKNEHATEKDDDVKKAISDILTMLEAFKVERQAMNSNNTGGFIQQGSNIDVIFSSFYWVWKSGCSVNEFPALSKFLNGLGQKFVGKAKMLETLSGVKFKWGKGLLNIISKDNFADRIHMHPAVLTSSRINNDMVSCFGIVPAHNPDLAENGCASLRNITNFETRKNNICAAAIASLFRVYKAAYPRYDQQEVVPMEHMLHQSFLGKTSAMQNSSMIVGNALDVNIVA
ncbi:nucleoprotein [Farallon virus]|uniref:Nucleoprotein n=1 Tax=Farallon virus TaxID=248053 RepID=A0A191KWA1_9VIRU|nr:nucleoprotein [Farallon virus]AMT75400.1 nucleoprotein [Farallon virus]